MEKNDGKMKAVGYNIRGTIGKCKTIEDSMALIDTLMATIDTIKESQCLYDLATTAGVATGIAYSCLNLEIIDNDNFNNFLKIILLTSADRYETLEKAQS